MKRMALTLAGALAITAAGAATATGTTAAASGETAAAPAAITAAEMEEGQKLYKRNCRLCHGTKGTSGIRLAGNEKLADASYVAHVVLIGPGYMTPFEDKLSDEEIATITTFVRNAWGNQFGPVSAEEVARQRQ